jgi:hypothetical protein
LAQNKNEDENMSILIVPTPGTPDGPCRGSCDHRKCHSLRAIAEERCDHCGGRFGFGTKITGEPAMHMRCAQTIAARNGAPAAHPINEPIGGGHLPAGHHGDKH